MSNKDAVKCTEGVGDFRCDRCNLTFTETAYHQYDVLVYDENIKELSPIDTIRLCDDCNDTHQAIVDRWS